ncbi:hypothetical protein V1389_14605 [Flavobacterium rakeshii]|uniref:hypothetical protein n=1 Tax=Flavobacterium rakeshii TaxID=1038845 RepID=UPI002E7BFE62|nr:hypothetical protein [Flavobacterium rakeshii]MEE1899577.1 hypothetical protein [Flavobacterium rakeshii]
MKSLTLLFIFAFVALSCDDKTDIPVIEESSNVKVTFVHNGKLVELDNFYINDIVFLPTQEVVGKHLVAEDDLFNDSVLTSYNAEFFFDTTDDSYQLSGVQISVREKFPNQTVSALTTVYKNIFEDYEGVYFLHNIAKDGKQIKGDFEGDFVDRALYDTISISEGKINYILP